MGEEAGHARPARLQALTRRTRRSARGVKQRSAAPKRRHLTPEKTEFVLLRRGSSSDRRTRFAATAAGGAIKQATWRS
jgi:hypothetical protein